MLRLQEDSLDSKDEPFSLWRVSEVCSKGTSLTSSQTATTVKRCNNEVVNERTVWNIKKLSKEYRCELYLEVNGLITLRTIPMNLWILPSTVRNVIERLREFK